MHSPSLHSRLRTATADLHAGLDARFAGRLADRECYATYLLGMRRIVAAFDDATVSFDEATLPQAWRPASRVAALDADLAALALAPLPAAAFDINAAGWLGACYVIEGSALGANVLLGQLQAQPEVTHPTHFLRSHAAAAAGWRACLARLETQPESDAPAIIAGAVRMFTMAEASFALADGRTR